MVDQRDSLLREVDEELRREQMLKLWQQYGTYVIAAGVLIIAGVGGVKFYQHRAAVAAEEAGARFAVATRDAAQKSGANKAMEDLALKGPSGYATLARLRLAAADRAAGKTAEAALSYEALAKERGVDPLLADYARLQSAMLRLDTDSWTDMQNRLTDLAAEASPWRFSARELLGLAAYKAGKAEDARRQFQKLLDDRTAPPSIAERARVMMTMLTEAELAGSPATPGAEKAAPPAKDDKAVKKAPEKASPKTDGKAK